MHVCLHKTKMMPALYLGHSACESGDQNYLIMQMKFNISMIRRSSGDENSHRLAEIGSECLPVVLS